MSNSYVERSNARPNRDFVKESVHCVFFFILLFTLMSLATFHPEDATSFGVSSASSSARAESYHNLLGPFGARLADWGLQLFGAGSLLFAFAFLAMALSVFQETPPRGRLWMRSFGLSQLLLCALGFLHLCAPQLSFRGAAFGGGGALGLAVGTAMASLVGRTGGLICLACGILASLPLAFGVRPLTATARTLKLISARKLSRKIEELDSDQAQDGSEASASRRLLSGSEDESRDWESRMSRAELGHEEPATREELGLTARLAARFASRPPAAAAALPIDESLVGDAHRDAWTKLLDVASHDGQRADDPQVVAELQREAELLIEKLQTYGVSGSVLRSQAGPVVNLHEFEPSPGIKVGKVLSLQDDLALGLKAQSVLMAPQPGKSTIGVEIPARKRQVVSFRDLMESAEFQASRAPLPMALGKLVDGAPLVADLSAMPHLLVAGSTGSGKSVGINSMILSLIMNRSPDQLRLILVDPKMLELSNYDGIGHLLMPVVTEPRLAAGALKWAINEMERRYRLMKDFQVRNLAGFNALLAQGGAAAMENSTIEVPTKPLPYVVVVIDELCDLMMTAPRDVEESVQRLAQKARAAGIHLILATQRPSVDVLTGVIKANLPCRIAFQVASKHDSRTIIEGMGAEKLLGKGDMLFLPPGTSKLVRAHGAFVTDREINGVLASIRAAYPVSFDAKVLDEVDAESQRLSQKSDGDGEGSAGISPDDLMDENLLFEKAVEFAVETGSVSTSSIQRHFRIGYNRAARLMDRMVKQGLVGPGDAPGKPRPVIAGQR